MDDEKYICIDGNVWCWQDKIIYELSKTGLFIYPKLYTTHPVRERIKAGKIHVTEKDYKDISSKVVEFCYNQYKYAITDKELQRDKIFDLAPSGFRSLQENYNGPKKFVIIYIWIDEKERINRMKNERETNKTSSHGLSMRNQNIIYRRDC